MVTAPPLTLVEYRCYKPFKGERCGKLLTVADADSKYIRVPCPRCRNLVIFPEPSYIDN